MADTLALIEESLPEGRDKGWISTLSRRLQRGESSRAPAGLEALFARGEEAGAEAFEEMARGMAIEYEIAQRTREIVGWLILFAVGISISTFGWRRIDASAFYGLELLSNDTPFALVILGPLSWMLLLGCACLIALLLVVPRRIVQGLPGMSELRAASALRGYSAARGAGIPPEAAERLLAKGSKKDLLNAGGLLSPAALGTFRWLSSRRGDGEAAAVLASELEHTGRRRLRIISQSAPHALWIVVLLIGWAFGALLYLPIFELAGVIE